MIYRKDRRQKVISGSISPGAKRFAMSQNLKFNLKKAKRPSPWSGLYIFLLIAAVLHFIILGWSKSFTWHVKTDVIEKFDVKVVDKLDDPDKNRTERISTAGQIAQAFSARDFERAIKISSDYLEKYPDDPNRDIILMYRADAYIGLNKDYEKAEADVKEVIKMGKQGATPYLFLASHIYNDNEKPREGYEAIKKAYSISKDIEHDPFFKGSKARLASFYTIAGELAHDCGDYEASINFIKKAIKLGSLEHNSLFARNEIAMAYYKKGDLKKAQEYSTEWLKYDAPVLKEKYLDYNYYINMSNAHMILGNAKEAFYYLDECVKVGPKHESMGIYHYERGRIYFRIGDYKNARKEFNIVRTKYAADAKTLDIFDIERMEKIMNMKEKAGKGGGKSGKTKTKLPEDKEKLKREALNLLDNRQFEKAAKKISEYLAKYPNTPDRDDMLLKRADAYIGYIEERTNVPGFSNFKEYKLAEADLLEVAKRGKKGATPYLMLATQLYSGNDMDEEAYNALKKAYEISADIEKEPFFKRVEKGGAVNSKASLAEFYTLAGAVCEKTGRYEEALKHYDRAIQLNDLKEYPIYSSTEILRDDTLLYRARTYFKLDKLALARKDAMEWLNKYKPTSVEHPENCENLAYAYLILGEYDKALDLVEKLRKHNPEFYGVYILKGQIQMMKGDYKGARESFEIVRKHISDGKYRYDLVELKRLEGKMK